MTVLGLTGGVGMGKSACARLLCERGVPLVDTDALAHELVEPGEPALAELRREFGEAMVDTQGRLDRRALARKVFSDSAARQRLEAILHPRIRQRWLAQVSAWRSEGKTLVVVVIPLLFETEAQKELDATICIACSAATQLARLQARGWSAEQIQQRVAAQWPVEQKIAAADYVIWSEGSIEIHAAQLDHILQRFPQP